MGIFICFILPFIISGILFIDGNFCSAKKKKRRQNNYGMRKQRTPSKNSKLYIHNMQNDYAA